MTMTNDIQIISGLYHRYVGREPLIDDTNAIVMESFRNQLTPTLEQDMVDFLDRYGFIGQRIASRYDTQYTFRQSWILLVYYFVKFHPNRLKESWPLTMRELETVFSDMGMAF